MCAIYHLFALLAAINESTKNEGQTKKLWTRSENTTHGSLKPEAKVLCLKAHNLHEMDKARRLAEGTTQDHLNMNGSKMTTRVILIFKIRCANDGED